MLDYLYTHNGKYYSGTGLNYIDSLKKVKLNPKTFPEKELLCVFVQDPSESETAAICRDFEIDDKYFKRYKNEKRSLRYFLNPLIFTLTDYYTKDYHIKTANILFVIKKNMLLVIVSKEDIYFKELFDKVIENTLVRKIKSEAYILYQFLQQDTKETYDVIEIMDNEINTLEGKIIHNVDGSHSLLEEIFRIKKELITMNKRLWASSKIIFTIKKDLTSIKLNKEERALLDDIYDTLMHQIDLVETQKSNVIDFLEIFTTQVSNKLAKTSNELNMVMKKMAALTIIIMVPTLIAGIYGMNFHYMPEIKWYYGYGFSLLLMFFSASLVYSIFHRKGWV